MSSVYKSSHVVRKIERLSGDAEALIPCISDPSNKRATTSSCGFLRHERWRTNEHFEKGDARHSTPIDRHSVSRTRNDRARWSTVTAEKLPPTSSTMQHDRVLPVVFTSLSKIMQFRQVHNGSLANEWLENGENLWSATAVTVDERSEKAYCIIKLKTKMKKQNTRNISKKKKNTIIDVNINYWHLLFIEERISN